jgi:hypothetical protein
MGWGEITTTCWQVTGRRALKMYCKKRVGTLAALGREAGRLHALRAPFHWRRFAPSIGGVVDGVNAAGAV